jgi:hypothetical protein
MPEATNQVIVDHTSGLHKCIANCCANEFEAAFGKIFAHRLGMRTAGRHVFCVLPAVLHWPSVDELPNISVEAAAFLLDGEEGAGILDGRANFEQVANDRIICQQSCNISLVVSGYFARIEALEGGAICGTLLQDGNPAQTGLGALQDNEFEETAVVVQRHAPFFIVVSNRKRIPRPNATLNPSLAFVFCCQFRLTWDYTSAIYRGGREVSGVQTLWSRTEIFPGADDGRRFKRPCPPLR